MMVGDKFNKEFEVSKDIYDGFIKIFKDRNELHTDRDFAKAKGFKSEVMHGNILNGFLSYFIGECLPIRNVIIHSQQIMYSRPVYLADNLRLSAECINVFESVGALEFSFRFYNRDDMTVAKGKFQIGII